MLRQHCGQIPLHGYAGMFILVYLFQEVLNAHFRKIPLHDSPVIFILIVAMHVWKHSTQSHIDMEGRVMLQSNSNAMRGHEPVL
jgi:hypothetical protein